MTRIPFMISFPRSHPVATTILQDSWGFNEIPRPKAIHSLADERAAFQATFRIPSDVPHHLQRKPPLRGPQRHRGNSRRAAATTWPLTVASTLPVPAQGRAPSPRLATACRSHPRASHATPGQIGAEHGDPRVGPSRAALNAASRRTAETIRGRFIGSAGCAVRQRPPPPKPPCGTTRPPLRTHSRGRPRMSRPSGSYHSRHASSERTSRPNRSNAPPKHSYWCRLLRSAMTARASLGDPTEKKARRPDSGKGVGQATFHTRYCIIARYLGQLRFGGTLHAHSFPALRVPERIRERSEGLPVSSIACSIAVRPRLPRSFEPYGCQVRPPPRQPRESLELPASLRPDHCGSSARVELQETEPCPQQRARSHPDSRSRRGWQSRAAHVWVASLSTWRLPPSNPRLRLRDRCERSSDTVGLRSEGAGCVSRSPFDVSIETVRKTSACP